MKREERRGEKRGHVEKKGCEEAGTCAGLPAMTADRRVRGAYAHAKGARVIDQ